MCVLSGFPSLLTPRFDVQLLHGNNVHAPLTGSNVLVARDCPKCEYLLQACGTGVFLKIGELDSCSTCHGSGD